MQRIATTHGVMRHGFRRLTSVKAQSRIWLLAAAAALSSGRAAVAQPPGRDTIRVVAPTPNPRETYRAERDATRGVLLADLAAARERWRAAGTPRLQFRIQFECYCFGVPALPLYAMVDARGDSVLSVVDQEGRPTRTLYPQDGQPSVPWLFAFAEDAIRGSADRVAIAFDAALGIPTRIVLDPRVNAIDDELVIAVSHIAIAAGR